MWQPLPGIAGGLTAIALYEACRGKYVALLEGDDYWSSPHKLQKQVNFLEQNPDFVICFHNVLKLFEDTNNPNQYFHGPNFNPVWTIEDLLRGTGSFIPTCSTVYRNNLFSEWPDCFLSWPVGDWALHVLNARYGKIRYFDEVMGVYRIHSQSYWATKQAKDRLLVVRPIIEQLETFNKYFNFKYKEIIDTTLFKLYQEVLESNINQGKNVEILEIAKKIQNLCYPTYYLQILYVKAIAEARLGKYLEAKESLETLLVNNPHHREARRLLQELKPYVPKNEPEHHAARRLHIGYVSPNFQEHPVAYLIEPLLKRHDRSVVKTYCYAEVEQPDQITERIRSAADVWRSTVGLSERQLAQLIGRDQIDILVDLAGHGESSRLKVFALKPAPIQASYLGYFATTGLPTIDYWLTDAILHPEGTAEKTSETIWRLPRCYLAYRPRPEAPAVSPLPCLAKGAITFGCLHNFAKMNATVIALWSKILDQVPQARLLVKTSYQDMSDPEERSSIEQMFSEQGISPERLELVSHQPSCTDYLALYHNIDIHLDTFPYTGRTTTCESLWMGVPVLTLAGQRQIERVSTTMLQTVGLEDWVAHSGEEYVHKAVEFAHNQEYLQQLRATMRNRLQKSPLCDLQGMARSLEEAYRQMWQGYLETLSSSCYAKPI